MPRADEYMRLWESSWKHYLAGEWVDEELCGERMDELWCAMCDDEQIEVKRLALEHPDKRMTRDRPWEPHVCVCGECDPFWSGFGDSDVAVS